MMLLSPLPTEVLMTIATPGTAVLPRLTVSQLLDTMERAGLPMPFGGGPRDEGPDEGRREAAPSVPISADPMFGGQILGESGERASASTPADLGGTADEDDDHYDDYDDEDGAFMYGPDAGIPGNGAALLTSVASGSGVPAPDGVVDHGALTVSTGFALVDLELTASSAAESASLPAGSPIMLGLRLWRGKDGTRRITATSVKMFEVGALVPR
jgi:hypothetical protein